MGSAVPAKYQLFTVLALGAGAVGAAVGRQIASGPGVPAGAVIHRADGRTAGSPRVSGRLQSRPHHVRRPMPGIPVRRSASRPIRRPAVKAWELPHELLASRLEVTGPIGQASQLDEPARIPGDSVEHHDLHIDELAATRGRGAQRDSGRQHHTHAGPRRAHDRLDAWFSVRAGPIDNHHIGAILTFDKVDLERDRSRDIPSSGRIRSPIIALVRSSADSGRPDDTLERPSTRHSSKTASSGSSEPAPSNALNVSLAPSSTAAKETGAGSSATTSTDTD